MAVSTLAATELSVTVVSSKVLSEVHMCRASRSLTQSDAEGEFLTP